MEIVPTVARRVLKENCVKRVSHLCSVDLCLSHELFTERQISGTYYKEIVKKCHYILQLVVMANLEKIAITIVQETA